MTSRPAKFVQYAALASGAVISDTIFAMAHTEASFRRFTSCPICDAKSAGEVLPALSCDSRYQVKTLAAEGAVFLLPLVSGSRRTRLGGLVHDASRILARVGCAITRAVRHRPPGRFLRIGEQLLRNFA